MRSGFSDGIYFQLLQSIRGIWVALQPLSILQSAAIAPCNLQGVSLFANCETSHAKDIFCHKYKDLKGRARLSQKCIDS